MTASVIYNASVMSQAVVGAALRGARKARGLSVAKASLQLGVSPATLKRWESGQGVPSPRELEPYAEYLQVLPDSPLRLAIEGDLATGVVSEMPGRPIMRLLRAIRRRHHITLESVSFLTGISLASLHRYETGERTPDTDSLKKITAACGFEPRLTEALTHSIQICPKHFDESGLVVMDNFLYRLDLPHLHLYRLLEQLLYMGQPNAVEIYYVVNGFATMGDHQGLLEVWPLLKPLADEAHWTPEDRLSVGSTLLLARINTTRDKASTMRAFEKKRAQFYALPVLENPSGTAMLLSRAAILLGERGEAEALLREPRRLATVNDDRTTKFICELHQLAVDFDRHASDTHLRALENLHKLAEGPLQRYNVEVAVVAMMERLGDRAGLTNALETCRLTELAHGFGSPLATRVARRLATQSGKLA